ncbi:Aste57867_168 [Aphanomyces stellatus]|uniref:Aste57867_168 protein n=1 Tax=Aphanomyces stellatus TaxID=120398 RepID=A0A485K725_9STRA|nr:hypothetical protein As57867_000168 [Aphanomyces stellatus]VFT77394.1 Aste57867_168 [Aphanomyces stellatus]
MVQMDVNWFLAPAIVVALLMPFLFVFATWDHEMFRQFPLLPGPLDWGSKEFAFRCWLSRWVRMGWVSRSRMLAPCPRIALQTKFTILDAEIANVKASLGASSSDGVSSVPLIFPQVICGYLLVQLLGNSHFPCPVDALIWKRLHVTQLRDIEVDEELNCLMVLIDKKHISEGVEFTVQTDLFDEEGVVWQSSFYFVVPLAHSTSNTIPLSMPSNPIDANTMNSTFKSKTKTIRLPCSAERLAAFNLGGAVDVERFSLWGTQTPRATPLWIAAAATSAIGKQGQTIDFPLVCHCVADSALLKFPPSSELECDVAAKVEDGTTKVITFHVRSGSSSVLSGYLRSVGWKYVAPEEGDSPSAP